MHMHAHVQVNKGAALKMNKVAQLKGYREGDRNKLQIAIHTHLRETLYRQQIVEAPTLPLTHACTCVCMRTYAYMWPFHACMHVAAVRQVLETLVQFGAPERILLDGKPHL